jgi:hypothetical protein
LGLQCAVRDRHGRPAPGTPTVQSVQGVVVGSDCPSLAASRSGFDTLLVQLQGLQVELPVVIALRPSVSSALGDPVVVDSLPAGLEPWAPTLIRNSRGELDLYFGGYSPDSTAPTGLRGDLLRLTSSDDGASFRYDGVALTRDSIPCSLNGDGIENVAIVPRADAAGWRMYYASGGFTCYGWQTFSAVSSDERHWTREAGVRISNGGTLPPAPPVTAPWPSGEGIQVDQLPSGEWRMIAGTYENITPRVDKFQITEWRSSDQLTWTYHGARLTTDAVGPDADRSIYSPVISEYTPGIYRLFFTGDNLNQPGGRSRLYTAVSLDRTTWQIEGVLVGDSHTNFFYSSLADGHLVFIKQGIGQPRFLAITDVFMP